MPFRIIFFRPLKSRGKARSGGTPLPTQSFTFGSVGSFRKTYNLSDSLSNGVRNSYVQDKAGFWVQTQTYIFEAKTGVFCVELAAFFSVLNAQRLFVPGLIFTPKKVW